MFRRHRRLLIGVALLVIVLAVAIGVYAYNENQPLEKRGSATEEFVVTDEPEPPPPPPDKEIARAWPTYGYDIGRQHISPYDHRPPFRRLWKIDAHDTLEFPPSIGYGRVYLAQQKGLFFALDAKTGKVDWKKDTNRCAASSPTIGKGVVYQAYMHPVECLQDQAGANGYVVAWDADTGRELWRHDTAPVESSPLLRNDTLYVGTWNNDVIALNAKTGRQKWRFQADQQVNTSAAYWKGRIFIASDGGTLYALNAGNGKQIWSAQSNSSFGSREFWYATPTIAYGRVYIGNTDGTMYVYGAKTRQPALGAPARLVHLRCRSRLQAQGLRRHLRREALRARRGHGRHALGDRCAGRGPRRADRDGRARVLRRLLDLRLGGAARSGAGPRLDLRGACERRQAASGASATGSTRTRWWPTRSGCTSPGSRTSTRLRRAARRARARTPRQTVPPARRSATRARKPGQAPRARGERPVLNA